MNWRRLLTHDLQHGLVRFRYLLIPLLVMLPCYQCLRDSISFGEPGSWIDYMLYIFKGTLPINFDNSVKDVQLPFAWILSVGGCLLINLDYLLTDLSLCGQQVLIRTGKRAAWYLIKCTWNLCSCATYFFIISLTAWLLSLFSGGRMSLTPTSSISDLLSISNGDCCLTSTQAIQIAILVPYLTIAALSLIEMGLCLYVKPVVSFLICLSILVLSVYWNSSLSLGNGAMTIRSIFVTANGIDPNIAGAVAALLIIVSAVMGTFRFKYIDIINIEE